VIILGWILVILFAAVLLLLQPIRFAWTARALSRQQLQADQHPTEIDALPPEVARTIGEIIDELKVTGFMVEANYEEANRIAGLSSIHLVLTNRELCTIAQYLIFVINKVVLLKTLTFETKLADGRTITTSNANRSRITPPKPRTSGLRISRPLRPMALAEIHQSRVRRSNSPAEALCEPSQLMEVLNQDFQLHQAWMRECGYYRFTADGQGIELSGKGLFMNFLKLTPFVAAVANLFHELAVDRAIKNWRADVEPNPATAEAVESDPQ
jgi:hypothetical protein